MKWLLISAVVVVFILSAYLLHAHNESKAKRKREAFYELKLQSYDDHQFGLGSTRRQVEAQLMASGAQFHQICCFHQHGSVLTDLVKVGEEKGSWYCSGVWINVAFDFHAVNAHDSLKADDTDVLDQVAMFQEAEGCL